ncbi:hypothetical protein K503DRAFT_771880 [Rhizopogon vinicolor AM-OR11-026]|uniref:Uncharacterized protein n=1 Tax=Rhizopogon vinicolor AM-OR11-026 TaxID=1314800 RepID=A0A1B7MWT7_9AGAM|nr:hypothetical protein K503DRAFT_771880 [Rhizopogon vinicolor AM-OR11-026]
MRHIVRVHAISPNRSHELAFEEASDANVAVSFRSREWSVIVSVHHGAATAACFLHLRISYCGGSISCEVWISDRLYLRCKAVHHASIRT